MLLNDANGVFDMRSNLYVEPPKQYRCFFAVIRESSEDFSVIVLNLPGVVGAGVTEEDAVSDACDAVRLATQVYQEDGTEVPWETKFEVPEGAKLRRILVNAAEDT